MCRPYPIVVLLGLATLLARVLLAHECSPCETRTCPPLTSLGCLAGRSLARDPCGCCERCAGLQGESCGGKDWEVGICEEGLNCETADGTGPVKPPDRGLCKGKLKCSDVKCPDQLKADCPADSILRQDLVSENSCCPTASQQCVCDQEACVKKTCPEGFLLILMSEGKGTPGECCDVYECQRVSTKCFHDGKVYGDREVYRMDTCWLCQCRQGISFCSKVECAELECDSFYIPDGECCPVCKDIELLHLGSGGASCWAGNTLRQHEEQWKEDDCTFCQCVSGDPHCTAMSCKQSCQNPVKIPGECCPFCEEPTYQTVSPVLCPKLENCSLSEKDCPFGFVQDRNGCLLCHCLSNDSCPDLTTYCSLQCPTGYEVDDYGCQVCECVSQILKCRPVSCGKTCPHGYVKNKHGCEMCRCVKCPPFTCGKECPEGYKQNRKGCSVCACKETGEILTTTPPLAPKISYCLTTSGHRYKEGESWHDGCRDCYCHAGHEMCVLITCLVPNCSHPMVREEQCCPSCEDDSGSGHPETPDLVVCRAPGGELYVEGETWQLDTCTRCTCRQGRVLCDTEVCPPVLCHSPFKAQTACCYACPDDQLKPLLPINASQQDFCMSSNGEISLAGESWKENPCTSCICNKGTIRCFSQGCPPAFCRVPVLRKGQCCPQCLDGTTTVIPVILSTRSSTLQTSYADEQTQRLPTTEPHTTVSSTDMKILHEDYPIQTEMALIYQSAAWVLAGILLAIVIFLSSAILMNKKKNGIQMPCYGAPKKTVILKKHVNKNSVVYMEPSNEDAFQSIRNGYTLGLAKDLSSPGRDRYGSKQNTPLD
ncbi:cysteine-rich motor neuron 1 protein-like isoform X1 [Erpetoichthys calabaricus]|nr:cysteine-rich motor neuron 1 protein-like isoform X1 [Erpetoichthys calabaricus]